MSAIEPAGEKIARHLQEAVARLHEDIARVELWAGALGCFARPVPDYDMASSKFRLPPKSPAKQPVKQRSDGHGMRETAKNGNGSKRKSGPM